MAESKLVMLVDTKRCIACNSYAVACKVEEQPAQGRGGDASRRSAARI